MFRHSLIYFVLKFQLQNSTLIVKNTALIKITNYDAFENIYQDLNIKTSRKYCKDSGLAEFPFQGLRITVIDCARISLMRPNV